MRTKRLYFDIETSPNIVYSWRIGYKINLTPDNIIKERAIICICYKWEHQKKVHALKWDNGCDKKMLEDFYEVAKSAHEIVGHNSDRFDIKWVRSRFLFHRIPDLPNFTSIDSLKDMRSRFLLNSNRLDYIGKFLGVGQKIDTGGFKLWIDVCNGNKRALKDMVNYCKQDVLLLERVYEEVENYTTVKSNRAVMAGGEKWQCPKCGGVHIRCNKTRTTKTGIIRREMKCMNDKCKRSYTVSNKVYMDFLQWKMLNGKKMQ